MGSMAYPCALARPPFIPAAEAEDDADGHRIIPNKRSPVVPAECPRCRYPIADPPPATHATPGQQAAYLDALAARPHVEYPALYVAHPEWDDEPESFRTEIDRLTRLLPRAIINIPGDLYDTAEERAKLLAEADGVILYLSRNRRIDDNALDDVVAAAASGLPVLVHSPTTGTAAWVDCETLKRRQRADHGRVRLPRPIDPTLPTWLATVRAMGGAADA